MPRVSIALPVYNGAEFLGGAIESLLAQTFTDFELVIVDNASTDGSSDICRAFAARDARIRYHLNEVNIGGGPNWNRAFELTQPTELFKWAAHDDLHAPRFLETCVAALDADPGAVLAFTRAAMVDRELRPLGTRTQDPHVRDPDVFQRFQALLPSSDCMEIFAVIRRSALTGRPAMGQYVDGDGVLLAILALRGRFLEVPEILFTNRHHGGQASTRNQRDQHKYSVWWDPENAHRLVFPMWRRLWELWRLFLEVPLPPRDRLRCARALAHWTRWRRARLADDVLYYPRQALGMAKPTGE